MATFKSKSAKASVASPQSRLIELDEGVLVAADTSTEDAAPSKTKAAPKKKGKSLLDTPFVGKPSASCFDDEWLACQMEALAFAVANADPTQIEGQTSLLAHMWDGIQDHPLNAQGRAMIAEWAAEESATIVERALKAQPKPHLENKD